MGAFKDFFREYWLMGAVAMIDAFLITTGPLWITVFTPR